MENNLKHMICYISVKSPRKNLIKTKQKNKKRIGKFY